MKRVNLSFTVFGAALLLLVAVAADPATAVIWELDCDSGAVFTWQAMVTDSVGDPIPSGDYELIYCYYEDSAGLILIGCCTTIATVGASSKGSKNDKAAFGGSALAELTYAQPIWEDTTKVGHFPKMTVRPDIWLELTFNGEVMSPLTLVTSVPNSGTAQRVLGDIYTAPGRALIVEPPQASSGMVDLLGNDTVASVGIYRPTDDILPMIIMEVTDTSSILAVFDTSRNTTISITGDGAGTFDGLVWSKTGFKFPDSTIQTTAWTGGGSCNWSVYDSVLYTNNYWGIARGGAGNVLAGDSIHTMVNLGVACTTGQAVGGCSYATIGGGFDNLASGSGSTIGGGEQNTASGDFSTVGGGRHNVADTGYSTISGGYYNTASGERSTVSGGYVNTASGDRSTVGGGHDNIASGSSSTVGGGYGNTASGSSSTVGGGYRNSNAGDYSVIPGGYQDTLTSIAEYSMIFGKGLWVQDSFVVHFFNDTKSGRFRINRDNRDGFSNYPIHVGVALSNNGNGAHLTGGGAWTDGSSREFKEKFQQLDGKDILNRIDKLPMESWEYKGTGERHIWPCAEDFHEAFDVGVLKEDGTRDTKYLAAGDVAGVALAGVKELAKDNRELRERIEQLEALVEALLAQQDGSNEPKAEFGMNK